MTRMGMLGALLTVGLCACGGGTGTGDAGNSGGTTGGGSGALNEGQECSGTVGQQADCAAGEQCTAVSPTDDICRVSCTSNAECTVPGETCLGSACGCTPGATDSCTAASAGTICHPDYGVCVTKGSSTPTCGSGECADPLLEICRPMGNCGGVDAGSCGTDDTQGNCTTWPDYCLSESCTPAQNVSALGADEASNACTTSSSTQQGSGNLDSDRASNGQEALATDGALITDLKQLVVASDADCALLGNGATQYNGGSGGTGVCTGGTADAAGQSNCGSGEVAVLFSGMVFDPKNAFATAEGSSLDGQFYRLSANGSGNPVNLTASGSAVGAQVTGHVIPGTGWTAGGGPFTLVRCLGVGGGDYPTIMTNYPVTLHFADTGIPGNSFCAGWQP